LIEQGFTSRQHSIGYLKDSFTGQKTQPTVSKYCTEGTQKYNKRTYTYRKKTANYLVDNNTIG